MYYSGFQGLILGGILLGLLFTPHGMAKKDDERKAAKEAIIEKKYDGLVAYTLAAGTTFVTTLETPLSTSLNQPDNIFRMRIIHDTWVDEEVIIHKGATVIGHIDEIRYPQEGKNAEMRLIPHGLETLEGEEIPIEATVFTAKDAKGKIGGEVTQPVNARLIRYEVWGIGQYNRVMPAGPRAMGEHQAFSPGQLLRVRLDKPMTVMVQTEDDRWVD